MKRRVTNDWRTKQRLMTITSQYGEAFDVRQMSWAQEQALYQLLLPTYQVSSETGVVTLYYNLEGLTSLKEYVRRFQVSSQDIATWMCDLAEVYGRCTSGGTGRYWQRSLLFESDCVCIDSCRRMRFMFVPLRGVPFSAGNIPLTTLGFIADPQKVTYDNSQTHMVAARLGAYVLEGQETFSFNSYRAFIQELYGIVVSPSGELGQLERRGHGMHSQSLQGSSTLTVADPIAETGFAKTGIADNSTVLTRTDGSTVLETRVIDGSGSSSSHAITRLSTGEALPLPEGIEVILGRGADCSIRLQGNSGISRHHASALVQGGSITLCDLGSSNGTSVNGTRLAKQQAAVVSLPCRIALGSEELYAT